MDPLPKVGADTIMGIKTSEQWSEEVDPRAELAKRYAEVERELPVRDTIKIYKQAIAWIFYAQLIIFGYGIDGVIAATLVSIPKFREDYGEKFDTGSASVTYIISASWLSWWTGISQLCAISGAAATGYLADRIGRKLTNALLCLISIGGVAAQIFFPTAPWG